MIIGPAGFMAGPKKRTKRPRERRGVRAGQLYRSRTKLNARGWRYVKVVRVVNDPPMATVREVGPGGKPVRGRSPVPGLKRGAPFPVYLRFVGGHTAMPEDFEAVSL